MQNWYKKYVLRFVHVHYVAKQNAFSTTTCRGITIGLFKQESVQGYIITLLN